MEYLAQSCVLMVLSKGKKIRRSNSPKVKQPSNSCEPKRVEVVCLTFCSFKLILKRVVGHLHIQGYIKKIFKDVW